MYFHPVKKSISLVILYSVIIVGIFVLQFRNESVISKNFGSLRISLAQTQDKAGNTSLKNSIQVSFKGISFTADEVFPAILTKKIIDENNKERTVTEHLVLESYDQPTPLSVIFNFNGGSSLTFTASDETPNANLSVFSTMPKDATSITLNFKPTSGYSVTDKTLARQIFSSKNNMYAFTASKITDEEIILTNKTPFATFSVYDPSTVFSFAAVDSTSPIASKSTYDTCIKSFREQLISLTNESFKTSSQINESCIVAYVAEMISQGKYAEGLANVPDSFKKGLKRTYLSTPYFGALEAMQPSMKMKYENMREMIELASNITELSQSSLNIFTVEDLADYIYLFGATDSIKKLLSLPSAILDEMSRKTSDEQEVTLTVAQATGIIRTYLKLSNYKMNLYEYLTPTIAKCLSVIEENCTLSDSALIITEKETPISSLLALETGAVLIEYGNINGTTEHSTTGYAIINTVLTQNTPDLMTIAEAYPIIINNKNYPHYVMLYREKNIWTWTMADSVSYTERNNIGSITMHSSVGDIYYQIINNLPAFKDINIYGLSYHSDPRFESYASSGYVHRANTKTLFLKTKHKSENEVVKFTY